jgi:hypothetical protein
VTVKVKFYYFSKIPRGEKMVICLRCRQTWDARVDEPSRCPHCHGYHLLDEETFKRIADRTEEFVMEGFPARFPRIDIIRAIVKEYGLFKLRALELLNLEEMVYEELERRHGPYWFLKYVKF